MDATNAATIISSSLISDNDMDFLTWFSSGIILGLFSITIYLSKLIDKATNPKIKKTTMNN